jgi:hypothetical protein
MSNVAINIAAEFTGKKAFKQAETSTDKLVKSTKRLAASIGLAFGTTQILAFGKASIKAALEAQAQQERLANLVKVTVGATDAQVQSLNDQAAALQAIGVVNKENITQTQSQLATFNLQIDTIKALTPAILDYVTAEKGAAASASEFKSMTNGLAQALNGNFASLTKVGFVLDDVTKKTIKEGTETERAAALVKVLDSTYKDFNKNLANTPTGQMQKLANAADDAKQIIGTGLLDALRSIGEDTSVENLANNMQAVAVYVADVTRGIGKLTSALNNIPIIGNFNVGMIPILGTYLNVLRESGKQTAIQTSADNSHLKSLQNQFKLSTKIVNNAKKLSAEELKQLKTKKLQQAIDKANLALNKGEEVFDMDKIQIAAALTSQAEQLGKATSSAQVLQIANDIARLNVKKSILALEDAIAAKDEAAITAATKKLNADLKVLGTLGAQNLKLLDIKSLLESLKPKDLINLSNLEAALALLGKINLASTGSTKAPTGVAASGIPAGDFISPISTTGGSIASILEYAEAASARANAFADLLDMQTAADAAAFNASSLGNAAGNNIAITVNTGVGDPNAIAEAIDEVLQQAVSRGTLRGGLFAV